MTRLWVLLSLAVFCIPGEENLEKGLSKAPVGLWSVTLLLSQVVTPCWQSPASALCWIPAGWSTALSELDEHIPQG